MAALPARDWAAFTAHWTRTLADETVIKRTIVSAGQLAGNIVSWEHDGRREVGYWIGTDFWGRGIATRALSEFLDVERTPLSSPTWPSRTAPRSASCRSAGSGGSARTTAAEA